MIDRCYCVTSTNYPRYGGCGVVVCDGWRSFETFLADMGERPSRAHSLDRIDGGLGYEPSNCRWALATVQGRNRKTCKIITAFGQTAPAVELAERYGVDAQKLYQRLRRGWTAERALSTPT